MLSVHQVALYIHIIIGACALFLFWVPVFARKGNMDHKRFGRYFALIVGLILLAVGVRAGNILFIVFGILQGVTATGNLRYIFRRELRPKEWWLQHLSGLIGSGIGAYTAFTVFGGRRLFEEIFSSNFESLSVYLWIMPGVVGGLAITLLSRHYKQRFGGEWLVRRVHFRSGLGK